MCSMAEWSEQGPFFLLSLFLLYPPNMVNKALLTILKGVEIDQWFNDQLSGIIFWLMHQSIWFV